jgi:hypothetical protein
MRGAHSTFRLPKEVLSINKEERYSALHEMFSHSDLYCGDAGNEWEISMFFPSSIDRYIDVDILSGLNWWRPNMEVEQIPLDYKQADFGNVMLHDTWTLKSWLGMIERTNFSEITILHLDAHSDLMQPKIGSVNGELYYLTTGQRCDLHNPEDVEKAVMAGSLDQGCYIIPFLHVSSLVNIIHITPKPNILEFSIMRPTFQEDKSLWPNSMRMSAELVRQPLQQQNTYNHQSSSYYRISNLKVVRDLLDKSDSPIFLHIDMDYFCNRYNGQSDWYKNEIDPDDTLLKVLSRIDSVAYYILDSKTRERIECIDIALVPGFFPSEYWEPAIMHLAEVLS